MKSLSIFSLAVFFFPLGFAMEKRSLEEMTEDTLKQIKKTKPELVRKNAAHNVRFLNKFREKEKGEEVDQDDLIMAVSSLSNDISKIKNRQTKINNEDRNFTKFGFLALGGSAFTYFSLNCSWISQKFSYLPYLFGSASGYFGIKAMTSWYYKSKAQAKFDKILTPQQQIAIREKEQYSEDEELS